MEFETVWFLRRVVTWEAAGFVELVTAMGGGTGGAGRGAIRFSFFHIVYSDKEEFNFVNCT